MNHSFSGTLTIVSFIESLICDILLFPPHLQSKSKRKTDGNQLQNYTPEEGHVYRPVPISSVNSERHNWHNRDHSKAQLLSLIIINNSYSSQILMALIAYGFDIAPCLILQLSSRVGVSNSQFRLMISLKIIYKKQTNKQTDNEKLIHIQHVFDFVKYV